MNRLTIKAQLNLYLQQGKINWIQLKEIELRIGKNKLMKDLTNKERNIILEYVKG